MNDPKQSTPTVTRERSDDVPLISIVIPAFNVAPYLQACLVGALREIDTARALAKMEFEIIVVDDCSSDETGSLARDLLRDRTDARIVIHGKNRGLAAARNTGIDAARGDYFLFLDSDNTLLDGSLTRVVEALSENVETDVIILGMDIIDVHGERTGLFYGDHVPPNPLGRLQRDPLLLLDGNLMDNFCVIRASAARMARYDESLRQLEDWDFWIRLRYEHQCVFAMIDAPVGGYRMRPGQMTGEHTLQNKVFVRTTLQIYSKALAMALRLDLPLAAVQRLLANAQNIGSIYLQLATAPAPVAEPERHPTHSNTSQLIQLATAQVNFGTKAVTFAYRRDSVGDKGVMAQIFQSEDYNLRHWAQGRRFLDYYAASVAARPGLIVDAGANIGASAVYFLESFKNSFVYAIEPELKNFKLLEFNTREYQSKRNRHAAIAAKDGELYLDDPGLSDWGFRTKITAPGESAAAKIPAISVASVLGEVPRAIPMIFKCDIEGGEDNLFSADTTWVSMFPVVIIELHDWMLPFSGGSRNFIQVVAQNDFDFVHRGENIFLFNRRLLG